MAAIFHNRDHRGSRQPALTQHTSGEAHDRRGVRRSSRRMICDAMRSAWGAQPHRPDLPFTNPLDNAPLDTRVGEVIFGTMADVEGIDDAQALLNESAGVAVASAEEFERELAGWASSSIASIPETACIATTDRSQHLGGEAWSNRFTRS
jgi:hypothetical protein